MCILAARAAITSAFLVGMYCSVWVMTLLFISGVRRAHPFTPLGRATMRWYRERDRRAADFMHAGLTPREATDRATTDMVREADEIIRL